MRDVYKTKKEKDAEAIGHIIIIILVVAFLAVFVFIWIGYKILQFAYRNFLMEKIYAIMAKDWNILYSKYNESKKIGDYNEDIHEYFFKQDLYYYYDQVLSKKVSKVKMKISGIEYKKICIIFNKILRKKQNNYKRIAIIWLLVFILYIILLFIFSIWIYKNYITK